MVEGGTKEGFATVKSFLQSEPRVFCDLLHRIAQATIGYLKAQIAAGAAAVQLFDTWCGELALSEYEEFALPPVQEIIGALAGLRQSFITRRRRTIYCQRGSVGANVLSVDWRVNLADLRKLAGARVAIQGNLDPALLLHRRLCCARRWRRFCGNLAAWAHFESWARNPATTPIETAQLFIHTGQQTAFRRYCRFRCALSRAPGCALN